MNVTTCGRCGRVLRAAKSVAAGYGAACLRAEIARRLEGFPAWQVDKAREAIELGAVVPTTRRELYAIVSSDGTQTYVVDARWKACTCKAAANGWACYHVAAAIIASVAAPVALAA